jgi:peptidoglycan/LPS O-acetylase OafA/YrhL
MGKAMAALLLFFILAGCGFQSGPEGSPALKLFGALGICLAAVFLIFYIVVKSREKD